MVTRLHILLTLKCQPLILSFYLPRLGLSTWTCLGSNDSMVRLMLPALPASYLNNFFNNKDQNLIWELLTLSSPVSLTPMSTFSALGPDSSKNSRPGRKIRSSRPSSATKETQSQLGLQKNLSYLFIY